MRAGERIHWKNLAAFQVMAVLEGRGSLTVSGGILLCLALALTSALGQRDCTGVQCPPLENCIEETLEAGACCASCVRVGCECQGYMYYDCLRAGYRGGKIPAGASYYVDGGSTECKCPEGGGRIDCSFIPCPELPKNCIRTYQPQDGCPQCAGMGCVSSGEQYPVGHSFRVEPCTVCQCLGSGSLTCSEDPDCGQEGGRLEGPTDGVLSDQKDPAGGQQHDRREETDERETSSDGKRAVLDESLAYCCATGHHRAAEDGKCLKDLPHGGDSELCRELQEQCCLSTLEEVKCQAGVAAAIRNSPCTREAPDDTCGSDVYKRCCECCALGIRARSHGVPCDRIPALGRGCGRVPTSCCTESGSHLPSPSNRREPRRPPETASAEVDAGGGGRGEGDGRGSPTRASASALDHGCRGNNPCSQLCTSEEQSITCSCFAGYKMLNDGRTCEDVNECVTGNHNCSRHQRCINVEGSFRCAHGSEICEAGYTRNEQGICVDIDECQDSIGRCGPNLICQNTPGSFHCRPGPQCGPGLTLTPQGSCVDTNECVTLRHACARGFNCINTIGSYTCHRNIISCGRGYQPSEDNARCVDIDECLTGTHRCKGEQICRNLPGSFRCECRQGYQLDPYSKTCVDIDECQRYMGRICAQKCENSPGSFQCSCGPGYKLAEDGRNCQDVNECETSPCSQECANVYGSYQCYCRQGYALSQLDRNTCEDIDECSQLASPLCAYRCINTPGTFSCICPEGYVLSMNGRNCRDLDECTLGTHNCTMAETCFNIQGGFKCLSFECPASYRKVGQTRCERLFCQDYVECQTVPQRITYYHLSFPTNIRVPANIFRISPSPVYVGDNILLGITSGNEGMFFSTRRLNNYTGYVYLQLQPREPRDFLLDVEMTLIRQGRATKFIARIYVFITGPSL
ncbi:fibulin-1-like [Heterodontus francisci]|uniref:fibulin-1-like n=1 Tax=Heterodontus francisci TaxID=7792 RepID=UPI00355AE21A